MNREFTIDSLWEELKDTANKKERETIVISETIYRLVTAFIDARKAKGLSQRDLAEITGLKQSAIARFESIQVIPRLDTIAKLAYYLDINIAPYLVQKAEKVTPKIIYVYQKHEMISNKYTPSVAYSLRGNYGCAETVA